MIYTHAAAALVAGALAFGSAWQIQNWRADAHEKDRIELAATQERAVHAVEQASRDAIIAATNLARVREAQLRADAARARNALVGLRSATDGAVTAARASHDACVESSTKLGDVLKSCSERYESVARDADLWESDALMLRDAWPK